MVVGYKLGNLLEVTTLADSGFVGCDIFFGVFPKIGVPQNGWCIMENLFKMDDSGGTLFLETSNTTILLTLPRTCTFHDLFTTPANTGKCEVPVSYQRAMPECPLMHHQEDKSKIFKTHNPSSSKLSTKEQGL